MAADKNPLDNTSHYYKQLAPKWETVADVYTGEIIDDPSKYLIQRTQGEPDEAFKLRCKYAHYTGYFPNITDSLVGELLAVNPERDYGSLGDPEVTGTLANSFYYNADGCGKDYDVVLADLVSNLILYNEAWVCIEGINPKTGQPSVKVIPPLAVPNHDEEQVWVRQEVEVGDVWSGVSVEEQIVAYTAYGWTRMKKGEKDGVEVLEEQEYTSPVLDARGNPALPVFKVKLPIHRYVTWELAKSVIRIFELTSFRDISFINASVLGKVIADVEDETFKKMADAYTLGSAIIQGKAEYKTPEVAIAQEFREVLEDKVTELYRVGFKALDQAAQARTATEARIHRAESTGAFLAMVAAAMSEAETKILRAIQQVHFPQNPASWDAVVSWKGAYRSIEELIDQVPGPTFQPREDLETE